MCSTGGGSGSNPWDGLTSATQSLSAEDVTSWSDAQVRDGLLALLAEVNRLSAVVSTVAASFDTRSLAELDGFRTARSWLIGYGRMTQGAAGGWLSRGRLMAQLPALAAAAHAGEVSAEQMRPVGALVDHVGIGAVAPFDQILADLAAESRPADVELACNRIRAHVDPDGPDPDPGAGARRGLTLSRSGSLFSVAGRLDAEGGATVLTALDALMRPPTPDDPRTAAQRRADAMVELARQALQGGTVPTVGGVRPQLGLLLTPDALVGSANTNKQPPVANAARADTARADTARADTVRADEAEAATAGSANGAAATVSAGVAGGAGVGAPDAAGIRPPDALECAGVPMLPELPWNSWAQHLPVSVAQRLACDCEVWRVILDPASGLPLEVGRAHRIVPPWIRKALHARDRGCRWPGCTAPAAWTEVHHLVAWYYGGLTNVDNCVLACRWHHGLLHDDLPDDKRWQIHLDPTTGEVTVSRPGGQRYELGPSQPYRPEDTQPRGPDRA